MNVEFKNNTQLKAVNEQSPQTCVNIKIRHAKQVGFDEISLP